MSLFVKQKILVTPTQTAFIRHLTPKDPDKNNSGVSIIWGKLFGTLARERK
ncbi:MAG: hypothetical protein ACXWC7_00555 [Chitinophagaceae bacterium]